MLDPSVQASTFPAKFTNDVVYTTFIPDTVGYFLQGIDQNGVPDAQQRLPNLTSLVGFTNLYSPNFAKGVK